MDDTQKAQLEADAEALDRTAQVADFFAQVASDSGDAGGGDARHAEAQSLHRWAAFDRAYANGAYG